MLTIKIQLDFNYQLKYKYTWNLLEILNYDYFINSDTFFTQIFFWILYIKTISL